MADGREDREPEHLEFVEIARFPSRLEAEAIGHALDPHGIPFIVKNSDIGIFGPGMTGMSLEGAALCVPSNRLEEVGELLDCVVKPLPEGALGEEVEAGSDGPAEEDRTEDVR